MKTTYRKVLSRRTLLRGAGGLALGLPFLDEMRATSVYAQDPVPTVRAFNIFFGLGYQRAIQDYGLSGGSKLIPAEPLVDKFGDRLAFIRGIDQRIADGSGNAHYDGSSAAFTGTPADRINSSMSVTGGASLDQALRLHAYPNQLPAGVLNALNTGTWWRFSDSTERYIHSRLEDGSPAGDAVPPQDPTELFDKLFADVGVEADPEQTENSASIARAMNASVLDGLLEQYNYYRGPAGGLGDASRARITNYFEQIRAMEQEIAAAESGEEGTAECGAVANPGDGWYRHRAGGDGDGIDVTPEDVARETQAMARLFALGVACDRVRFGSYVFQSGGERIRMHGSYEYNGRNIVDWNEGTTSHELWHGNNFDRCAEHLHYMMYQIAYFLEQLDAIVEDGKSVLDTAMITISTESGNGQHNASELNHVLHIINSANGRFKVGQGDFIDVDADGIELYNTMLMAHDVPADRRLWDGRGDLSSSILA
jgi:hypothetical protein